MNAPAFAVLREPASAMNLKEAAAAMSLSLGGVATDNVRKLRDAPGILARSLSESEARAFVLALRERGVGAFAMAESKMAFPPNAEEVRDGRIEEEGFRFRTSRGVQLAPWSEIIYIDTARVRHQVERERKTFQTRPSWLKDHHAVGLGHGGMFVHTSDSPGRQPQKETVSAWKEVFDIVCYDPWEHLRIDRDSFRYAAAGMPLHPTNHLNFTALIVMVKARADKAECGPGVGLMLDGKPNTRATESSVEAYENNLLWRLQLLWR